MSSEYPSRPTPHCGPARRERAESPVRPSWPRPSWPAPSSRRSSWPAPSWPAAFFGRCPFGRLLLHRTPGPPVGQQLGGPLVGQLLHRIAPAQRGVGLAVGDVRAEPAVLDHHRLAGGRVHAQLLQRRRGGSPPAAQLGLGEDGLRLLQGDREQLLLGLQRPGVGAALDVRAVPAVLRGDLPLLDRAVLLDHPVHPDHPGQRQQLGGLGQRHRLQRHVLEQRRGALAVGDVRAVPAVLAGDLPAGVRVGADLEVAGRRRQQLLDLLPGQLVRRQVLGHRGPPLGLRPALLDVRAVPADPDHDVAVRAEQLDRVHPAGVDVLQPLGDQLLQPALGGDPAVVRAAPLGVAGAEVEPAQPVHPGGAAVRDRVQVVLHRGGEAVVDQPAEVALEQPGHRERHPGRDQRRALLPDVAAVLDGLHDRGVGGRPADAELLQRLDQRGLGVAGRRAGGVPGRLQRAHPELVAAGQLRQPALAVVPAGSAARLGRLVGVLDVGAQEAREGDGPPGGGELGPLTGHRGAGQPDRDGGADRVGHLRGQRALPDQLVQPELVRAQPVGQLARGAEAVPGRPDRLVRLLGVLHLAAVVPGLGRHVGVAVQVAGLRPGRGQRRLGQVRRVGTHVGDVAVLVQPLGHPHGDLGRPAQLAAGLLLQRRGHERRVRPAPVRLLLDPGDRELGVGQPGGQPAGAGLVQVQHRRGRTSGGRVEVPAGGDPLVAEGDQGGPEGLRVVGLADGRREGALDVPVVGGPEGHPLALPLDHDPGRHRLHPAGGQLRQHLLPQHRGDLVAVEPVQDPPGLLGVHQRGVDVARLGHRPGDRGRGDLVEHHPADRHGRLQGLRQVPGDRLALAVLIGGQVDLVGVLDQRLELGHLLLAVRADHVQRLEVVRRCRRPAGPTAGPCRRPARRRRCAAGRGYDRSRPRRCTPRRGTRRSSSPSPETRRSPACCRCSPASRVPAPRNAPYL